VSGKRRIRPLRKKKELARVVGGDFAAGMETRMLLILILTAVTLTVGLCLIGLAVKAAKKDSVWEQVEDSEPRTTKVETKREAWLGEAGANEGLHARAAAAGERNGSLNV
jgi:hypothetical protein